MVEYPKDKLYMITFRGYTNCLKNTVSRDNEDESTDYIDIPLDSSMIIKEKDIPYYSQFGHGIETLKFVGNLYEHDESKKEV